MAFIKLDTGLLNSSLWLDRDARDIFLTGLLEAKPFEVKTPLPQLQVRSLDPTGWTVPPGWYGIVEAAGIGLVARAGLQLEQGLPALERLGSPDQDSRSREFEGRRLVRVNGGFLVLNYCRYREKDHTVAERQRRYRERHGLSPKRASSPKSHLTDAIASEPSASASASASACVTKRYITLDNGVTSSKGKSTYHPETAAVLDHLILKTGRAFRHVPANLKLISARLSEPGVDLDGVKKMIDRQYQKWGNDPKMREYLRPETLFNATKFDGYYTACDLPTIAPSRPSTANNDPRKNIATFTAGQSDTLP